MSQPIEKFAVGPMQVKIFHDDSLAADPRGNDNLGIMLCWHPHYELGDEQFRGPADVGGATNMAEVARWLVKRGAENLIGLFLYDHSGLSLSAGPTLDGRNDAEAVSKAGRNPFDTAGWDTSMVGFIYTTSERRRAMVTSAVHVEEALRAEIAEYSAFLAGEVYGYTVERDGEMIDSCWGFVGDIDYVRQQARNSAKIAR